MALWGVRDIVFAVVCRVAVCARINTEQREVSGVAWPHPVVGVSTELSDALWRVSDKADVAVVAIDKQVELILVIEGFYLGTEVGIDALFFLFNL